MIESDNEEMRLLPTDPVTDSHRQMIMEQQLQVSPLIVAPEKPKLQFGIYHLMFGTTVFAVAAALLQWFAPQLLAATIGTVALLILIVAGCIRVRDRAFTVAFWCVMVLYVAFSIIAAIIG